MQGGKIFSPKNLPKGPWEILLKHAFAIIDDLEKHGGIKNPFWTFGGGTVLMLRHAHRQSKDIDIFVPDPQYLGFVTPRLSDVAASITEDYVEAAGFVKLIRPEGEIDFVAAPNLTDKPYETWKLLGREVKVETSAEIVAKKLWHRGDVATARDLFDLSLVIEKEPESLKTASMHLKRHSKEFVKQLKDRATLLQSQFEDIDTLNYSPSYSDALKQAEAFLKHL